MIRNAENKRASPTLHVSKIRASIKSLLENQESFPVTFAMSAYRLYRHDIGFAGGPGLLPDRDENERHANDRRPLSLCSRKTSIS